MALLIECEKCKKQFLVEENWTGGVLCPHCGEINNIGVINKQLQEDNIQEIKEPEKKIKTKTKQEKEESLLKALKIIKILLLPVGLLMVALGLVQIVWNNNEQLQPFMWNMSGFGVLNVVLGFLCLGWFIYFQVSLAKTYPEWIKVLKSKKAWRITLIAFGIGLLFFVLGATGTIGIAISLILVVILFIVACATIGLIFKHL